MTYANSHRQYPPAPPGPAYGHPGPPPTPILAPHQRAERLTAHLGQLARQGWRVDQRWDSQASVSRPAVWMPPAVHALLALVTCGLWLVPMTAMRRRGVRRVAMTVAIGPEGKISTWHVRA